MARKQIKDYVGAFKVLGVVGDINFLDHDGLLVVDNQGQIEGWHFMTNPDNSDIVWVNSFELEQFKVVGDVDNESEVYLPMAWKNDWMGSLASREEWWAKYVSSFTCPEYTPEQFWEDICSNDPMRRASSYFQIGQYFGFHELSGGYERTESVKEWRKRLALPCYRARKRGITVYT